ncbi:MAG: LysR family transcriptional regulator [Alphaproteobacteria bacterium]|nr:LysR family transcriptional regulator [Alphaproteobacteria bacterium]
MSINLHHLRYFHAIVQNGGLVKAAERLNVSPSAVSVQLQALEDQLGHDLFERRGRQLLLTEAGRIALERAEAIFDAADELENTLKGFDRAKRANVRIGALATLSRNFQIAFLKPLLGRDDVRIVLRSGSMRELIQMLDAHHIDVLLSNTLPPRDEATSWTSHVISDQPISLIGPSSARRTSAPAKLLAEIPLIVPTLENHIRGEFDALVERLGIVPRIVAEVDDMALLRLLAREGTGYAIVPPIVVRDELATGLLKECGPLPGLKETFYAITPKRRFPNPLLKELMGARPAALKAPSRSRRHFNQ